MLQPDKLKKLNENASLMAAQGKSREEILAMKDAFIKQFGIEEPVVKKKDSSVSVTPRQQPKPTTASSSASGSLATPATKKKQEYWEDPNWNEGAVNKTVNWLGGIESYAAKSVLTFADDVINSAKNSLRGENFFDDDVPDTDTPITDAVKKGTSIPFKYKIQSDGGPLDPTPAIKAMANIGLKIINSTLPQDQKNVIIAALNLGSEKIKSSIRRIDTFQEKSGAKGNMPSEVIGGIVGMAPDLLTASVMKSPQAVEGKFTKAATKISEEARPLLKKYVPKVAKFVEEAVQAPFTKIMVAKGVASGMANAKEGEDIIDAGIEGGIEGGKEGVYMHALGVAAGKAMPIIAKGISKTGLNSAIATAIANPLANAGVFTTAKALRTGIEEQRLISGEEAAMEAATGVGFSLLHAGSLYKNHNELNHYYDNTLKTDPLNSLGRVINETKDNLELSYNPDLTESQIKDLEEARDELRVAIIKEPDLNNKKLLGDEALKIQNQLDAHSAIKGIVENKEAIIESINSNDDLSEEMKSEKTKKVAAIADYFDNSEFAVKKKELSAKINEAQKKLDDASLGFTNLTKQSDRVQAKIEIEKRRAELDVLSNELTNLITKQDAIQKQTTDESVLRTEKPEVELQGMGEGNAKPEGLTTEESIAIEKPQEVVDALKDEESTANALSSNESFNKNKINDSGILGDKLYESLQPFHDEYNSLVGTPGFEFEKTYSELKQKEADLISKAYHKAKADGSNPKLVKAVEELLAPKVEEVTTEIQPTATEKPTEITPTEPIVETSEVKTDIITDKNGDEYSVKSYPFETNSGIQGFRLNVVDGNGKRVADVGFFKDSDGKYYANNLFVEPEFRRKGIASSMYNFAESVIGEIKPSKLQTEEGRLFSESRTKAKATKTKFEDKAKKIADEIMKLDLPDWLKAETGDAKTQGVDSAVLKRAFADSVIKLGQLMDAGVEFSKALAEASKDLVGLLGQKNKDRIEDEIFDRFNKGEKLSEQALKGYNKFSSVVDGAIANGKTIDNIMNYMERSDVYKRANDIQKELLVREVRKKFGLSQKSAPSVGKLFGTIKDIAKITMTEKAALAKQLRDKARGARESIQEWKKQTKELTEDLTELKKSGKITTNQETAILNKFGKVNIFSEKSVARFTDYMTKVFNDADYKQKLSNARDTLSSIKKLSKNDTKNGDLRVLGAEFAKIDPSMIENIDEYNNIAKKIKEAIDGSKIRKADTKFAETVNIEDTAAYIEKTLEEQETKLREEKIAELQDLLGVDASTFSAEEIDALLESEKELSKDDEKIVKSTIKKAFDIYSSVIKEMLSTGKDPFTGEDVSFSEKEKSLIEKFMDIDPNKIKDPKDALRTVDSLINFIQNKSTAGMLKSIADHEAITGGEKIIKKGLKANRIRKYFSEKLGRVLGQKTTTLPVLAEKMFKGVNRALDFEEEAGVSDLINNSSKAESESNLITKGYVKEFYKRKANGEAYNTAYNDVERGILAHMTRNIIGIESRMKKVFDKRKQEVLDTIELLSSKGNDSEQELAKIIKKAYDKILDGSENIKDVKSKTDTNNVEGVEYWVNQWSERYEALSDLALNFYNKALGRDLGYTPDRVVKLQDKREDIDLEDTKSQFFANTDEILYDKKSGSLMDKQENRRIPKDMYIDFSFDKKNANAMNDALTDLYTAFDIRKVGSFLKSDNFRKIIPSSKDANLYDKRIKKFVRLTRRKTPFSNSEVSDLIKKADKLAKLGVTMSLASGKQPFIQTIPVLLSTAINAGGVNPLATFDLKYNKWLQDLGYAVSNRGVESQAQLESMNKLLEKAADMPRDKALKFIEKIQDESLKLLLVKGDVMVARASFKAYYEQSLKQQGEKYKKIDYSKHEVNKRAANYAQRMVDRQQNISNPALAGDLYTSESNFQNAVIKMLMPFSSFRMNQSSRIGSDLSTLEYWNTSTKQDKVIALKSIAGYTVEAAAYRVLQISAAILFNSIANSIMGKDDDEEDKKFEENLKKGAAIGTFVDTFSPIPLSDPFTQDALSYTAEEIQGIMDIPEEKRLQLFQSKEQSALKMLGTYGIPLEKAKDVYMLGRLAYNRKFKDKYGNEKEISEEDADKLKTFIGPLFAVSVLGVFSPDVSAITKKAVKKAQKDSKNTEVSTDTYEEYEKSQKEKKVLDSIIDSSYDQDIIDAAEQKKKELIYKGTDYQKSMNELEDLKKEKLLVDPETGTKYDNEEDLKKYNESLWNQNFGPNSDWEQEHKNEDAVNKIMNDALTKEEEAKYNYVNKKKNSDGTRKRSK